MLLAWPVTVDTVVADEAVAADRLVACTAENVAPVTDLSTPLAENK